MTEGESPLLAFTVETFAPLVGAPFRVHVDGGQVLETQLIEATPHGPAPTRDQFSLVFRSGMGPVLPQAIYRMDHDELGVFDLFIVPIGPDAEGMRYEAVFA